MRFVPTWMNTAPSSAATKRRGWNTPAKPASAVPTSTGASAAGSVRGRAARSQVLTPRSRARAQPRSRRSRPAREAREIGPALLKVRVTALLRLLAHVEEQVRVVSQLLDARQAILVGVEAGLEHAQREGGEGEHLAAPQDGLLLQTLERHHGVDQAHRERLLGVVLPAQEPDLPGLLGANQAREDAGAEAPVEAADAGADLAEAGVVGGDRQVADDVQHVAAPDRVPGHHRHDRLGQAADLHVEVGHLEAADGLVASGGGGIGAGDVAAARAPHPLVAARAEGLRALPGEDDHADLEVLAGAGEGILELDHRLRPERVA